MLPGLNLIDESSKAVVLFVVVAVFCLVFLFFALPTDAQEKLLVFAGAASQPPTEDAAALYEKKTGTKVELVFGGSG
jgi:molybdate transport system substrate-binding protein